MVNRRKRGSLGRTAMTSMDYVTDWKEFTLTVAKTAGTYKSTEDLLTTVFLD